MTGAAAPVARVVGGGCEGRQERIVAVVEGRERSVRSRHQSHKVVDIRIRQGQGIDVRGEIGRGVVGGALVSWGRGQAPGRD